jgi:hypothetical protein
MRASVPFMSRRINKSTTKGSSALLKLTSTLPLTCLRTSNHASESANAGTATGNEAEEIGPVTK